MAPRPFWKGYLKLSLVSCPVTMTPALSGQDKIRFHTLNEQTGNRVVSQYVDAESGELVEEDDQARGYPQAEDSYVILEDDELDAVALESTRTIDIDMFVPAKSIDWLWYDRPHFLSPADKVGEEAYSVIREAMVSTRTVGVARLVLYRRERAVMLAPRDRGIILWTLRFGDEVRDNPADKDALRGRKPDANLVRMIGRLIDQRTLDWSPDLVQDPVQDRLVDIIDAKKKKRRRPAKRPDSKDEAPTSNVVNIVDALRKSLASESARKER